jgi:hypothetical protein
VRRQRARRRTPRGDERAHDAVAHLARRLARERDREHALGTLDAREQRE